MKRAIQKYLEDPIAEEILKNDLKSGDNIMIDFDDKKKEITVKSSAAKKDDDHSSLASDVKKKKE